MNYIIQRCTKPPGLIIRALTYYLELNDQGLYIICLGNATAQPNTNDIISEAIANQAVKFFDKRYEKEIQKNEEILKKDGLEKSLKNKRSYFLTLAQISDFKVTQLNGSQIKIAIKGDVKITLICHSYYSAIASAMSDLINKK
jgi:hypothetical protein